MSLMLTATGRDYYLGGQHVLGNVIDIAEVAHHLAIINRFTGATSRPYSVAEHSVLVADIAKMADEPAVVQFACLMHDGHEYVTGDASSPAKREIGEGWDRFEGFHARAFRRQFALESLFAEFGDRVHHYDLVALATERRDLTMWCAQRNAPWEILTGIKAATFVQLNTPQREALPWHHWRGEFLQRFADLQRQIKSTTPAHPAPVTPAR